MTLERLREGYDEEVRALDDYRTRTGPARSREALAPRPDERESAHRRRLEAVYRTEFSRLERRRRLLRLCQESLQSQVEITDPQRRSFVLVASEDEFERLKGRCIGNRAWIRTHEKHLNHVSVALTRRLTVSEFTWLWVEPISGVQVRSLRQVFEQQEALRGRELQRVKVNLVIRLPSPEHEVTIDTDPYVAGERVYQYPYGRRVVRYPKGAFQAQYEVDAWVDVRPLPDVMPRTPRNEILRGEEPYVTEIEEAKRDFIAELDELFAGVAESNRWTARDVEEVLMSRVGKRIEKPQGVLKIHIERSVSGSYKRYMRWQRKLGKYI